MGLLVEPGDESACSLQGHVEIVDAEEEEEAVAGRRLLRAPQGPTRNLLSRCTTNLPNLLADIAALSKITAQPVRVAVRICQSDIAVRPDEIERRAEADAPHFLPPFKDVER